MLASSRPEKRFAKEFIKNLLRAVLDFKCYFGPHPVRVDLGRWGVYGPRMNVKYFQCPHGRTIIVGMDSASNDHLSLRVADQNDYWFHVAGFPGSHVVLCCENEKPDRDSIEAAAELAAWFSKMRKGGRVGVSYCLAKGVKKFRGAKPGQVQIKGEKVIKVRPKLHDEVEPPSVTSL